MTDQPTSPPQGEQMQALLDRAKRDLLNRVASSRSSKRRRRGRVVGTLAVGVIGLGGVTAATATGLFGSFSKTDTKTADFDIGAAPAGSTYVYVTLKGTCEPSTRYDVDLDRAKNPWSVICGPHDTGKPVRASYEMELVTKGPNHMITVTTNVERKYTLHALYRTGLTQSQKFTAQQKVWDEQRKQNARTVKRTDKVPSTDPYNHPAKWPDPYYVNENGMTIGTFDPQTTPYDQWPDLMPIEGPHGEHAFTYSGKRGSVVKNPGEAVAYMKWMVRTGQIDPIKKGRSSKTYTVFLAEDGKTVLAKKSDGSMRED